MREELTETVYAWVRDDCGVGLKMLLTRKETDALINRITAWNTRTKPPQDVGADLGLAAADDRERIAAALKPFAGLYNQITRDHGLDWFADEGQVMRAALAYPIANGAIVWRHFRLAAEALAAFQSRQEGK